MATNLIALATEGQARLPRLKYVDMLAFTGPGLWDEVDWEDVKDEVREAFEDNSIELIGLGSYC